MSKVFRLDAIGPNMRAYIDEHLVNAVSNLARELGRKPTIDQLERLIRGLMKVNPALKDEYFRASIADYLQRFRHAKYLSVKGEGG